VSFHALTELIVCMFSDYSGSGQHRGRQPS